MKVDLETRTAVRVLADESPGHVVKFDVGKTMLIVPKAWTKEAFGLEVNLVTHDYFATDIDIPISEADAAAKQQAEADAAAKKEAEAALEASAESRFNLWFAWGIALYECEWHARSRANRVALKCL